MSKNSVRMRDTADASASPQWDIAFRGLTAGYGEHVVLRDIDATLPGGRISVILGGSGCGKSTLLRHIIGLSRPLAGSVHIGGQDMFALPLTEHVRLPKAVIRDAALRVLRLVGLEDFADYYPNQLSGGMRKRAGLARAIIAEPRILLCDEPTSGLDPITAARMDALLLSLHERFPDMSIVVVSHDLDSLRTIADHVLVLREGKAVFSGPLAELEACDDPYLRRFLRREADAGDVAAQDSESDPRVRRAIAAWLDA